MPGGQRNADKYERGSPKNTFTYSTIKKFIQSNSPYQTALARSAIHSHFDLNSDVNTQSFIH